MNQRFGLALHILSYLDLECNQMCSSERIAESIQTNPVVVRRMLPLLKKAGFIETKRGQGGVKLKMDARQITIYDVYQLTENQFVNIKSYEHNDCPVGRLMYGAIHEALVDTEKSLITTLQSKTIKDISQNILEKINKEK